MIPSASTTVAPLLARFCAEHPHASVVIEPKLPTDVIVRRLAAFELDAGILYPFPEQPGLEQSPLYEETWTFLASEELLPEPPETMTWKTASEFPLAVLERGIHGVSAMAEAFRTAGVRPEIAVETDSVASLFALVNTGRWASMIPDRWALDSGSTTHLSFVELVEPRVRGRVVLAHGASRPAPPLIRALRESLLATAPGVSS